MERVFISHAAEDGALAAQLADGLTAAGVAAWTYERDSLPGPSYLDQILAALSQCSAVIVVVSPAALGSWQVEKEVVQIHERGLPILPLLHGLSYDDLHARRPAWAMAFGAAVALPLPADGDVSAALPRIVAGLHWLAAERGASATGTAAADVADQGAGETMLADVADQGGQARVVADVAEAAPRAREAPAAVLGDGQRHATLPAQPTAFIGRDDEIAAVRARLLDPQTRLLTLAGPGGVGKTRLALEVAARVATGTPRAARAGVAPGAAAAGQATPGSGDGASAFPDGASAFPDGVYFISLAALSDPGLVLDSIAQCLEVRETPAQALLDTLAAVLREKRLLLVLDNVEHLLAAAAPLQALIMATAHLKVLATSRAALRVRAERLYTVPPLAVPAPPLPPLAALSQYEAVRLFIERAQDADPAFAITNQSAPAVAEICARLDGLPLAIELAAARLRLLSAEELLARLGHRLAVARGGARDLPARQQTLRATIDWSYSLLDAAEQTLFARLAVFAGGRTLEAIEAVCNAAGDLPIAALDGVESLLDNNLLRREATATSSAAATHGDAVARAGHGAEAAEAARAGQGAGAGDGTRGADSVDNAPVGEAAGAGAGEPRLVMLETIHEYARERLAASGEQAALERAHAAYYLALAERAEPELRAPRQATWLARLEAEHDNLRAALAWSLAPGGDTDLGLRLAAALGQFWDIRGHWSEGRRHLAAALAQAGATPSRARARALLWAGRLAGAQRDRAEAGASLQESLALARALDDGGTAAETLAYMGNSAYSRGDLGRAATLLQESLALARAAGARWVMGYALNLLAWYAEDQGQRALAEERYGESGAIFRALGDTRGLAAVTGNLGWLAMLGGDYARASALMHESMTLNRAIGFRQGEVIAAINLGLLAVKQGQGRQALPQLSRALLTARELGETGLCLDACECIAEVAQQLDRAEPAARLLGAAHSLRQRLELHREGSYQDDYARLVAALRAALGAAFEAAWAAGAALALDEALQEALALAADALA